MALVQLVTTTVIQALERLKHQAITSHCHIRDWGSLVRAAIKGLLMRTPKRSGILFTSVNGGEVGI